MNALGACTSFAETWLDPVMLLLPFSLLLGELIRFRPSAVGRLLYLGSVCSGYTALLLSIRYHQQLLTLAIALSLSLFHATEYLAGVSWAVKMKHGRNGHGIFGHLVPRWVLALSTFMIVLALSAWLFDSRYHNLWAVVTIAVSYLHYAYDGIIWKVRTAQQSALVAGSQTLPRAMCRWHGRETVPRAVRDRILACVLATPANRSRCATLILTTFLPVHPFDNVRAPPCATRLHLAISAGCSGWQFVPCSFSWSPFTHAAEAPVENTSVPSS